MIKSRAFFAVAVLLSMMVAAGQPAAPARIDIDFEQLKTEAEALVAEGSYARANELYERALGETDLAPEQRRWAEFRAADTFWRSSFEDQTNMDRARQRLAAVIEATPAHDRDRIWAEAKESLGDSWWKPGRWRNQGQSWNLYREALDWWAGTSDVETARARYLAMVWRMADPDSRPGWYGGSYLPLDLCENAAKIAQDPEDRARAHLLLARALQQYGNIYQHKRIAGAFETAIASGRENPWYDDALFGYAQWLASSGPVRILEDGQWMQEPDFVRAIEVYRQLLREYKRGETAYFRQAQNAIKQITDPVLQSTVSNAFLPDSRIAFDLRWRNVKSIDLAIHKVDLTRDVDPTGGKRTHASAWVERIDLGAAEKVRSWTFDTKDDGRHRWGSEHTVLEEPLPVGAYVLVASAAGKKSRSLILVSDLAIVLKASGDKVVSYTCNALNGAPVAGARVRYLDMRYRDDRWVGIDDEQQSGGEGLAVHRVKPVPSNVYRGGMLVLVADGDRQAFAMTGVPVISTPGRQWKVYAVTDRPAYRPEDTVRWKITARRQIAGAYETPGGEKLKYEIHGPRGKVEDGTLDLNAFGSAWSELALSEAMALGEYSIAFRDAKGNGIGSSQLFRLEEYKLPEFEVTVSTPEEDGRKKTFRLGDVVEVSIGADYYFGGPVANATVQVLVYQQPHWHAWSLHRDYPWYYQDAGSRHWYGYGGNLIKQETLTTDETGRATLVFETPPAGGQDFEYRIEARVTDASRREVVGSDSVRVTRQSYYVNVRPEHSIYTPADEVVFAIQARDANGEPVTTDGEVRITRQVWREVWVDPLGHEVSGVALETARRDVAVFPPLPGPGKPPWRLVRSGYEREEIALKQVRTGEDGNAEVRFVPDRTGYYRAEWTSPDPGRPPITASGAVWVCERDTTRLGYHQPGVQIILDEDTARSGKTMPVMITVPTNDCWVLFTVEGRDLYHLEVIHVRGTVKLVELPIESSYIPNVTLQAAMVRSGQVFSDAKELVVPPVEEFLDVEIVADAEAYQPGDEGTFTVVTRDVDGNPVSAEIAFSVADAAVLAIQGEYAADPRQFFYGERQPNWVQGGHSFAHLAYLRLVESKDGQVVNEQLLGMLETDEFRSGERRDQLGRSAPGAGGGRFAGGAVYEAEGAVMDASFADARQAPSRGRMMKSAAMAPTAGAAPGDDMGGGAAVQVRSDFRTTLAWMPDVVTDDSGKATVKIDYADSLTRWKATARACTPGSQFGLADAVTRTRKPIIARLQAPRFFVVGDTVTLSGVINNNTETGQRVRVSLEVEGLEMVGVVADGRPISGAETTIDVPAGGDARVDWIVNAGEAGEALVRLIARGAEHADAMEKTYAVEEHGIDKLLYAGGKVRGDEVTVKIDLPARRRDGSTEMVVQVTPSMAVTMLDALPYLVEYPYGCTEQTMSRFLPAAITAKTLRDVGLSPEDALGQVFGGIEQAFVDETHRGGAAKRDNLRKLDEIVRAGLARLYDFQHGDGGWGWWKRGDSDHYMTAYVTWGLAMAENAGIDVRDDVVRSAARYLDLNLVEAERQPDLQAWMLHGLAAAATTFDNIKTKHAATAYDNLWTKRNALSAYGRACVALTAHMRGDRDRADVLVRNLENGVKRDETPDTSILVDRGQGSQPAVIATAHWGADRGWWRWWRGGIESTAFVLRALVTIDPEHELIEPAMNWLVKNRRGAQWSNTRDTAIVVLALNDYLRASGELRGGLEYEILVNGASVASRTVTAADVLAAPSRFTVDPEYLRNGVNEIRIVRRRGEGPLYFAAEARFFSLEEPITPAGNEIFVRRDYYRLVARETLLKGFVYDRVHLRDGDYVKSGERIEVVLTVESKNDYEYLVFEDQKPAGFEATDVTSGGDLTMRELRRDAVERRFDREDAGVEGGVRQPGVRPQGDYTGRSRWLHHELRDRKVAIFADRMAEGTWEIRYDMRAEVPGTFHGLPLLAHAMYVPEIRANGAEIRITVDDS